MEDILSWAATVTTIGAAVLTASNLGSRITGAGFAVFTVASLAWLGLGYVTGQPALLWTNVVMTGINAFGVWRWLGREARIEDGGKVAAKVSAQSPGEALFPVSLLTKGGLVGADGTTVASAVDAMAGAKSGRIAYLVASQGGVAGVGERFRRVEWEQVEVDGGAIRIGADAPPLERLPELEKDRWPGR